MPEVTAATKGATSAGPVASPPHAVAEPRRIAVAMATLQQDDDAVLGILSRVFRSVPVLPLLDEIHQPRSRNQEKRRQKHSEKTVQPDQRDVERDQSERDPKCAQRSVRLQENVPLRKVRLKVSCDP